MAKRKHINPVTFGLMGMAQGWLQELMAGIQTQRLHDAKMLEARELHAMAAGDRAEDRAWRQEDREDEQAWRKEDREAEVAFRTSLTDKEIASRERLQGAQEAGANARNNADISARAADREAERTWRKEQADAARITEWRLPDGTTGTSAWSEMPKNAVPVQVNGKNMYAPKPGQVGYVAPAGAGVLKPGAPGTPTFNPSAFASQYAGQQ